MVDNTFMYRPMPPDVKMAQINSDPIGGIDDSTASVWSGMRRWRLIHYGFVIAFVVLLVFAVLYIKWFYVCDNGQCRPYVEANITQNPTPQQLRIMLRYFDQASIWMVAFIGAAIATGLVFGLLERRLSFKECAMIFLVIFLVTYMLISLIFHHYITPTANLLSDALAEYEIRPPPSTPIA